MLPKCNRSDYAIISVPESKYSNICKSLNIMFPIRCIPLF
uniref:Uncharacterized protein n=1 Tax=Rhizophora mucronata TaxID=61149 RepID=A0A2P2NIL8_RHIMU